MLKNFMKSSVVLAGVASSTMAFAAEPVPVPVMAKNQSPHFNAVASQLEMGGLSFSYTDKASTNALYNGMLEMAVAYLDKHTEFKGVDAKKLAELCTLEAVKASGSSSTQRDGFVHYRSFSFMPEGHSVYAKAYLDGAPSVAMTLAPSGADLVLEMHLNGAYDPDAEFKMYAALGPLGAKLKELQAQQGENPMVKQWQELSKKINSRFVFVADISPAGFKGADGLPIHGQLLVSVTNAEEIWELAKPLLVEQGMEVTSTGDLDEILFPAEMMAWQPCLQYNSKSKQLYISTTQQYLDLCQKVSAGTADGLAKDKEFVKINGDLPQSYSALAYVSPAFSGVALNLIDVFGMPQIEKEEYIGPALRMLVDKLKASSVTNTGTVYAATVQSDGVLQVVNSPINMPDVGSPTTTTAVMLGLTSTLFVGAEHYRDSANQAACIINMSSTEKAARSMQNIMDHKEGDKLTWQMLMDGPLGGNKPSCPSGGSYTLSPTYTTANTPVVECSCEGHVLELR